MAGENYTKLSNLDGVGAGGLATQEIYARGILKGIILHFQDADSNRTLAEIKADVDIIDIKIEGRSAYTFTPSILSNLRQYFNYESGQIANANSGVLYVPLTPSYWKESAISDGYAWGLKNVTNVSVEVQFKAASGTTKVELYIETIPADDIPLGAHFTLSRHPFSTNSNGVQLISTLPKNRDVGVLAYAIAPQTDDDDFVATHIESIRVRNDNVEQRAEAPPEIYEAVQEHFGRNFFGAIYVIDWNLSNNPAGFLPLGAIDIQEIEINWKGIQGGGLNFDVWRIGVSGIDISQLASG